MSEQHDVVVVGSGAAGLATALVAASLGRSVVLLERATLVGGTSAFSGGMTWIPASSHFSEVGEQDSAETGAEYARGLTHGLQHDDHLIDVYAETGPAAVDYLEKVSPLRFRASRAYTDYYADHPGGRKGGRSLMPLPFDARGELGAWADRVRTSPHFPAPMTLDEMAGLRTEQGQDGDTPLTMTEALEIAAQRQTAGIVTGGRAFIASLLKGALDHGVDIRCAARVHSLEVTDRRVVGVVAEVDGTPQTFTATHGVVLASGGFEWDRQLVKTFLGITHPIPLSPPGNDGDALKMALTHGASVANMSAGWHYPCTLDPSLRFEGEPRGSLASPRNVPGSITLNSQGRRFVNEGAPYVDLPKTFLLYDPTTQTYPNEASAHLIFDQLVRDRVTINDLQPGRPTPDWVVQAPSLAELATALHLDPAVVVAEVERFNAHAAAGHDPDFGRGTLWFEGVARGGPSPDATLAPLTEPPFYAIELHHGLMGTAGGLLTDQDARVLDMNGEPISGLFACGTAAASIFGPMYPSGGAILGQCLVFGYRAGRALAAS